MVNYLPRAHFLSIKNIYTVAKEAIVDVHKEGKCYQDINKSLIMPICTVRAFFCKCKQHESVLDRLKTEALPKIDHSTAQKFVRKVKNWQMTNCEELVKEI